LTESVNTGWRAIIASSTIMSLALLGDALLYAVLPTYAEHFGLTLPWVGVMLSVNRLVRVFVYSIIAQLTQSIGVRRMCIAAAITATISTALYGFGHGPATMLAARILWGLTYATLVVATLSYAIESRERVGTRVGVSQAIQRSGPVLALIFGAWLVAHIGPQTVFIVLAVVTALAIPIAYKLPERVNPTVKKSRAFSLARPKPIDVLFFLQGYGVDGVFAVSITLIFARDAPLSEAVLSGGMLLAMRHFGEAIAAPLFGWVADRFGARRVFIAAAMLTVIAEGLMADEDAIGPLARMQAWRDIGAAAGPLATGFLLTVLSAEIQHALVAIAMSAGLVYWMHYKPELD